MSNALHNTHNVMKCTKFLNLAAAILLLAVVAGVGCKKGPQNPTPLGNYPNKGVVGDTPGGPIGDVPGVTGAGIPNSGDKKDWPVAADQPAALRDNTVYFAYDRAEVRASDTSKLDAVASYVKSGNKVIRIEGHADARGTEEYNRALGERRALSVREYLARAGVDPNNIDTISHGEDKPAVQGNNEAAWSKNRRAEFLLLQPPSGVGATGPQ
jgi:peptidoglycan-associated lipoprotein